MAKLLKTAFVLVAGLVGLATSAGNADAAFVNGAVSFNGLSGVTYNSSPASTATSFTLGSTTIVISNSVGDLGTIAVPSFPTIAPATFTEGVPGNTFTVAGFTFVIGALDFAPSASDVNTVVYEGQGVVSGNGYTPTIFDINGSSTQIIGTGGNNTSTAQFNITASGTGDNPVPAPGGLLLAAAAAPALGLRRILRKKA